MPVIANTEAPRLEFEEATPVYARLVAEPLTRGFGTTLGNALRRVLLNALPGAAVVAVRVDQVQHEFSTIPHMKEDTTEFLLNLRGIRLRALSDRPAKLFLDVRGERAVTAGDLEVPGDYEIVNPDLHLATLDAPGARLTATLDVRTGTGFALAAEGEAGPIGVIPLDALFAPVRKVAFSVQPTRVGQTSDLDRLVMEVWTDGTISGVDAVYAAAEVLQRELRLFLRPGTTLLALESPAERLGLSPAAYQTSIEELNLSVRAYNCLKRSGLMTVGQVLEKSQEELLGLRNFGEKSYDELMARLLEMGFLPADDPRAHRGEALVLPAREGLPLAPKAREARGSLAVADEDQETEDDEISSLGTALLEALREAGQDPEALR